MSQNFNKEKKRYQENLQDEPKFLASKSKAKKSRTNGTSDKSIPEEEKTLSNLLRNSKRIPAHSIGRYRKRWNKLKKGLTKGQWSLEEDRLLEEWIKNIGPRKWEQCGQYIHGRSGKQCREHWCNCLNPELIKGEWTYEEDFLIMQFYEKCNGSWKKIIPLFNGRTENSIKNRFFSQLRKLATKNMENSDKKICAKIKLDELKNYLEEGLSIAKRDFLEVNPMSEEELKEFLIQQELKIKQKTKEENETNESNLSTILGDLENSLSTYLKSDKKDESFLKKRKRSEEESSVDTTEKEREKEKKNNTIIKIDFEELENESVNNSIINIDDNKNNPLNNISITNIINENNNEIKTNINENNKEIVNNEESYKYNNLENDKDSKSSNAFDLKFEAFCDPFLENEIINRTNSFNELPIFNKFSYGFYNKPSTDSFVDKRNLNISNNDEMITFFNE
jgi:hypothetical protein